MKKLKKGLGLTMAAAMTLSAAAVPAVYADENTAADTAIPISITEAAGSEGDMAPIAGSETAAPDAQEAELISAPASAGYENFTKTAEYKEFSDVAADDWYHDYVKAAYELGLVKGVSEAYFRPQGDLTIAETVTLASRICDIYNGGSEKFIPGDVWYDVYVDYAANAGIITGPDQFADYNKPATRSEFAMIMASALPEEALPSINNVTELPDVTVETPAAKEIFALYGSGILKGNDEKGTYRPDSSITRAEVATIIMRMAVPGQRVHVEFSGPSAGMANPWKDASPEDIAGTLGLSLNVPEGAESAVFRMNETIKMEEVLFTLDGYDYTARVQPTEELTDISGIYIDWDPEYSDSITIGSCSGTIKTAFESGRTYQLCTWYDAAAGLTYSISVVADDDLDGFDLTAYAEAVYAPSEA